MLDLTWPQIYLMLDGALINAPDLPAEPNPTRDNGNSSQDPTSAEEALRRELKSYAALNPALGDPAFIEEQVRRMKERQNGGS